MVEKIFVIGFNKCGTTSLTQLFGKSGHKAVHTYVKRKGGERINIAEQMFLNHVVGNPLLRGIDGRILYSDMESNRFEWHLDGFLLFRELDAQYPDSKFILNLRDKEKWLRSRSHHNKGRYMRKFLSSTGFGSQDEVRALWSRQWDEHIAAVRAHFADKPGKLVEFDIVEDPISRLCDALPEYRLNPAHWEAHNVNAGLSAK